MSATPSDKSTQLVQLVLQGVNSLAQLIITTYTSVSVARLKAEVFAAAYAAHVRTGSLPEEARSLARSTAEYMYGLVGAKD